MKRITFFLMVLSCLVSESGAQNYFPHDSGIVLGYKGVAFYDSVPASGIGTPQFPYSDIFTCNIMFSGVVKNADGSELVLLRKFRPDSTNPAFVGNLSGARILIQGSRMKFWFQQETSPSNNCVETTPRFSDVFSGAPGETIIDSFVVFEKAIDSSLLGTVLIDTVYKGPYTRNGVTRDTIVLNLYTYDGRCTVLFDTVTILPRQTITVPAGTFDCMVTRHSGSNWSNLVSLINEIYGLSSVDVYKADGIGVVREIFHYSGTSNGQIHDLCSIKKLTPNSSSPLPQSFLQKKIINPMAFAESQYDLRGRKIATSKAPTFSGIRICASETALAKPYCRVLIN